MPSKRIQNREDEFFNLCKEVAACSKCDRMRGSIRVLGQSSGRTDAEIMFIGEAPGRLGADASAIPFHGDKSGHNFEDFLLQVGISRYDIFVTNSVLCNPKDENGNNSTPSKIEIANCASFLKRQILSIGPRIVVTLGAVSLSALNLIEPHNLTLSQHVRTANNWFKRILVPLYHPGQRAMVHRSRSNQLADYHFVADLLRRGHAGKRPNQTGNIGSAYPLVEAITRRKATLSYFALHKLFYLAECLAIEKLGRRLTTTFIVRQKDGPYCVDLHAAKLIASDLQLKLTLIANRSVVKRIDNPDIFLSSPHSKIELDREIEVIADLLIERYGAMSDAQLKKCAYLTSPMRSILREEKLGKNMLNAPLLRND